MGGVRGAGFGRLRFAYWCTLLGAGAAGLVILFARSWFVRLLGAPALDPYFVSVVGAGWLAFAALSILGLRRPLEFVPVLLLQFVYKTVWLIVFFVPALIRGGIPLHGWLLAAIFVFYVAVDLVVIPFRLVMNPRQNDDSRVSQAV